MRIASVIYSAGCFLILAVLFILERLDKIEAGTLSLIPGLLLIWLAICLLGFLACRYAIKKNHPGPRNT